MIQHVKGETLITILYTNDMFSHMVTVLENYFFFFQAEDGIRDGHVTGVQTCAHPICRPSQDRRAGGLVLILILAALTGMGIGWARGGRLGALGSLSFRNSWLLGTAIGLALIARQIGRASCRERGEISVGGGGVHKKAE